MLDCETCQAIDNDLWNVQLMINRYESGDMYRLLVKLRDELGIQWESHRQIDHEGME